MKLFGGGFLLCLLGLATSLRAPRQHGHVGGSRWGGAAIDGLGDGVTSSVLEVAQVAPVGAPGISAGLTPGSVVDITTKIFAVLGDYGDLQSSGAPGDDFESAKRRASFNLKVGTAMEVLRRELPMVFAVTNLDFSIFSQQITVVDQRQNKVVMPKTLYMAAVKSVRMASAISSMYPSMNVKKIEYVQDEKLIQCLVDVVLPDAVRIDGQAMWEGMFYFGLDEEGLINSHVFDRKVSNFRPSFHQAPAVNLPWLRATPTWSPDLIAPMPVPAIEQDRA